MGLTANGQRQLRCAAPAEQRQLHAVLGGVRNQPRSPVSLCSRQRRIQPGCYRDRENTRIHPGHLGRIRCRPLRRSALSKPRVTALAEGVTQPRSRCGLAPADSRRSDHSARHVWVDVASIAGNHHTKCNAPAHCPETLLRRGFFRKKRLTVTGQLPLERCGGRREFGVPSVTTGF